ncbi:hypothetical protein [Vibrio maritimus]|uniref:hypothetical protein n=1 Tax=Vibrio maritimus TaxID=990268 RepID=UPI001F3401A3|nr:hypothetical protein [Vibrio maritimus]
MKKSVLSSAILSAIVLSGCGGSNNEDVVNQGRTITVIDGYLENALVCVDRNNNGVCDEGELIGSTNSNGQFTIPTADQDYPVIIRSIAGQTKDLDRIGYLTQSYEMTASSSSSVVTPFTTLANANDMSVEDLAAELEFDESVISGDYVSLKQDADQSKDAIMAHALARSLVQELPTESANINGDELKKTAEDINSAIEEHYGHSNDINEIDENDFVRSDDGGFEVVEVINDLQNYLIKGNEDKDAPISEWNIANFSNYWATEEGVFSAWLTEDDLCVLENGDIECMTYSVNGDVLSITSEDGEAENNVFIYTSTDLAFAVPDEGDLTLWTTNDLVESMSFTVSDFENKTWFIVMDDSNNATSEPVYGELRFGEYNTDAQTGVVTLIDAEGNIETNWTLPNGNLRIGFEEHPEENPLVVRYATTNGTIMIVNDVEQNADVFSLMTQDEALALNIVSKWEEASK